MAVLTAGAAIKDDLLWQFGEGVEDSADEEYKRDLQYVYEDSRARFLRKEMSKERFDELMIKCRDREFTTKIAERRRELNRLFAEGEEIAAKYGITEEDINEAIREVKDEERAKMEQAGNK